MEIGTIKPTDIREEMQTAYLDYAMSVITSRALPDVRDGLKPVQRRILFQMGEMGLRHNVATRKCARIVGDVLGRFHPHGDQSVYDALVRMAQDFTMRYPLVDGQGNFGSIDGDPPAAMRYCVTGDTLVVTNRGMVPMAELSDGSEDVNLVVLSRDQKINTVSKWWDCGAFPARTVETQRGYQITATLNHPLLIAVRDEITGRTKLAWKLLREIQPGDFVVLDRSQALWTQQYVQLASFYPKLAEQSRTERHTLPHQLNQDLAFLMGALLAEGTFRPQVIEFTNNHGDLADEFQAAWKRVFPTCRLHIFERKPNSYGKHPWLQIQIVSQQVVAFFQNLGLTGRSAERLIPSLILRSPKEVVASFLRGLYEGDAAVEHSGKSLLRISLCARNRAMLHQVQLLLLRFGIVSTLNHERARNMYRALISGRENLVSFQSHIGFVSETKQQALANILSVHSGRVLTQSDYVPFLSNYVRTHAQRGQREWLGKHNFDRTDRLTATLPRLQKALTHEDYAYVEMLARSRYLFERVVSVQDAGNQRVYSLRVDSDCHSFVANGFINHNTEARLTELAEELLADIDMDTVDFYPNFDDTLKQPSVLPGKVPNLLINGGNGIAVGMATLIPPHNLSEICDAVNYLVDHWNKIDDIEPDDLMQFVKGPDFPTGGIILGADGIKEAYATGRGRIVVRGKLHTEPLSGGRTRIVVTEIPYQVNKTTLIERIAELVRDKKIEEIGDLRDESDRQGMSLLVELKRGVDATPVINSLLKHTALQSAFSVNMLAIVDGEPRVMSLKRALQLFVQHRQHVITRRTEFELERAKLRAHILEGLKIALDNLDEVIRTIRQSQDADQARERLMKRFKLSELQATAILDMQLRRLAALERKKIEDELAEIRKRIKYLEELLRSPKKILGVIQAECSDLKERFGDARRTFIAQTTETEFKAGAEVAGAEEGIALVTLSRDGVLRKAPTSQYRRTRTDAVNGVTERSDDPTISLLTANTTDNLVLFTNRGRALPMRLTNVPDVARNPSGVSLANQLESGEKFINVLAFNGDRENRQANANVTLATAQGKIKRTTLEELSNIQAGGTRVVNLAEGEELGWVYLTQGGGEFLITTAQGQALRFEEETVPVQGRASAGVWAIKLTENDQVISLDIVEKDAWLVVASAKGFAKRVAIKEFPTKGRYTGGVTVFAPDNKTGALAAARVATLDEDVMFIAASGLNVRVRAENITKANRAAKGKLFVTLKESDAVARLTSLVGQAEGIEDKKEEKKKDVVAVSSNGHASENGQVKKAEAKRDTRKQVEAESAKQVEKETGKKARAEKTEAKKEKSSAKKSAPAKTSKAESKKDKAAPPTVANARRSVPPRRTVHDDEDAEQMELPIASFKPLPKKVKK